MELKKIIYSSYNVVGYLDFCCCCCSSDICWNHLIFVGTV